MSNDYNGNSLTTVASLVEPVTFLANFENKLYWLSQHTHKMTMYDVMTGEKKDSPSALDGSAHFLQIVQDQQQRMSSNKCSLASCSHICLPSSGKGSAYTCACPSGWSIALGNSSHCTLDNTTATTAASFLSTTALRENKTATSASPDVQKEKLEGDNSATIIAVVVVLLLLVLLFCAAMYVYCTRRRTRKATNMVQFTNSNYSGGSPSSSANGQQVVKRGAIVSCDNPMFDSQNSTPGQGYSYKRFNFFNRQPRISVGNSPNMDFSSILTVAKGASTPSQPRREFDKDSAFTEPSASIDYEDLTDQHLSVSFHKDKHRLLSED